ncbi:MAG: SAM-dependent methyltransferase [Bacteroidetes bacterium]|nr:MAG: SAM-dependent methyltransferase [Bacteroidota bacterium]
MKRVLHLTEDGSHTLFATDMDEPYHSVRGAIRESKHVYIEQGLAELKKESVSILEIGLGTGLNLLLSLCDARFADKDIAYYAVEKFPLVEKEYRALNYPDLIGDCEPGLFQRIHECPWEQNIVLREGFNLFKHRADFREMRLPGSYDLVYFDAFAPDKQPELWSLAVFKKIGSRMNPGGILVSYTAKGSVRRNLKTIGFDVQKVPGPPGKREMIRAIKTGLGGV